MNITFIIRWSAGDTCMHAADLQMPDHLLISSESLFRVRWSATDLYHHSPNLMLVHLDHFTLMLYLIIPHAKPRSHRLQTERFVAFPSLPFGLSRDSMSLVCRSSVWYRSRWCDRGDHTYLVWLGYKCFFKMGPSLILIAYPYSKHILSVCLSWWIFLVLRYGYT